MALVACTKNKVLFVLSVHLTGSDTDTAFPGWILAWKKKANAVTTSNDWEAALYKMFGFVFNTALKLNSKELQNSAFSGIVPVLQGLTALGLGGMDKQNYLPEPPVLQAPSRY